MKKNLYAICFTLVLTAFTAYAALDTFVIPRGVQTEATEMNTAMFKDIDKSVLSPSETVAESAAADTEDTVEVREDDETESSRKPSRPGSDNKDGSGSSSDTGNSGSSRRKSGSSGKHSSSRSTGSSSETAVQAADTPVQTASASADGTVIGTYSDENMSITLTEYVRYDTHIYAADVTLSSAEYLKTAFADNTYGKNITGKTSSIAAGTGAVLAVNGDYYGAREYGYVIRNGVVYRNTADDEDLLCLYADGTMRIVSPSDATAEQLVSEGVWQAWSFGPALIDGSQITVGEKDEVGRAMASNPRTALGMIDKLHYVFVVSDGRTTESAGLSLSQLAEFMQSLGCTAAYNLDGGGSSSMYFQGSVINRPTTSGNSIKERGVSDIVYIG